MLNKRSIQTYGLVGVSVSVITIIACSIIIGYDYIYLAPDWRPFVWRVLPGLQITALVYALIMAILGYITFIIPSMICTIGFLCFLVISILLNLTVGIFTAIASSEGIANSLIGCDSNYTGIMNVWKDIDSYLIAVDQHFCSSECPCNLYNIQQYTGYTSYSRWVKNVPGNWNVRFQNCSNSAQEAAYNFTIKISPQFDSDNNFNATRLMDYMANIEKDFECVGWCQVDYYGEKSADKVSMDKYLFSNINRYSIILLLEAHLNTEVVSIE